jgi:hypothetical protein
MAGDALAAGTAILVMSVFLQSCGARAVRRAGTMAIETNLAGWLAKLRVVVRAVNIVASSAGHAVPVHGAFNEVVALHSVLVRCTVGEIEEICVPEGRTIEPPIVG